MLKANKKLFAFILSIDILLKGRGIKI